MASDTQTPTGSKWMFWAGWVMTALPALMLIMSGVMKILKPAELLKEFERLGYPENTVIPIGITEISCVVVYLIPQTSVLGAILLTGYLGGATATHVRLNEPFIFPIIGGVLVWGGLFLRDARIRALIPLRW